MRTILASLAALAFMLTACDEFVNKSNAALLKEKEQAVYVLKKDIDVDGRKLARGDRVKIVITGVKEWLKVYAYPAREEALKAERVLILFVFADDFPEGRFSMKYFDEQLDTVVAPAGTTVVPEKKTRKK